LPTQEVCGDNLDNDCNGVVDDCQLRNELITASWDSLTPIKLWEIDQPPKEVRSYLGGHTDIVYSVSIGGNGNFFLSGGQDGRVIYWNLQNGQIRWNSSQHQGAVHAVAMNSNASVLASAGADGKVLLWSQGGQVLHSLAANVGGVYALAHQPAGRLLVSGGADAKVYVWDTSTPTPSSLTSLFGHTLDVYALAVDAQNRWIVSAGRDPEVRVWDAATRQSLFVLSASPLGSTSLAFSRDGTMLAVGSAAGTVSLWDMTKTPPTLLSTLQVPNADPVYSLAFEPSGAHIAVGTYSNLVLVWDLFTRQVKHSISAHNGAVSSLMYRP
jgi:WD40 repeat protein